MKRLGFFVLLIASVAYATPLARSPGQVIYTDQNCGKLVGDKVHDDTAALNACFSRLINYQTLILSGKYRVTSTLTFAGKIGVVLKFSARGSDDSPGFFWDGANDVSEVLKLDGLNQVAIEGLHISTSALNSHNVAKWGLSLRNTGLTGVNTSDVTFRDLSIVNSESLANTPSDYVAIEINPDSAANVENIRFYGPGTVLCSTSSSSTAKGLGFEFGHNFNQKGDFIQNVNVIGCAKGVSRVDASIDVIGGNYQGNTIAFEAINPIDYCRISGVDGENNAIFFSGGRCTLQDNRVSVSNPGTGNAAIMLDTAEGTTMLLNNQFYDQVAGSHMITCQGHGYGGNAGHDGVGTGYKASENLVLSGNTGLLTDGTHGMDPTIMAQFAEDTFACGQVTILGDDPTTQGPMGFVLGGWTTGGYNASTLQGSTQQLPSTFNTGASSIANSGYTHFGVLGYDRGASGFPLEKVMMSEGGNPYEAVRPGQSGSDPQCVTDHDVGKIWVSNASTTVWKRCTKTTGTIGWATF